ncbi:homocysteine S-methyltransferase family protein [Roseibium algae]|uniref:Homocysteine S-methyltransferase family protein n=1 Tax=Roseibium algae TaxID=3123038 RepID=A0ABU8TJ70_9HYPH
MTNITLLDGGMSRELERCGAVLKQPEWSALALIDKPDAVRAAHEAFLKAGSDVVTTNTYAIVPFHLGQERFEACGHDLADLSGRLAQDAAKTKPGARIAGSLPPACGSYQPDNFDPEEAEKILSVLVRALEPHVHIWLAETMSSLEEAQVTAAAVAGSDHPLWISYTLRDDAAPGEMAEPLLRSNETVRDAVALAIKLEAEAILFNCSMPEVMQQAIESARQVMHTKGCNLPIGVYANAFGSQDEDGAANEVISEVRDDLKPDAYGLWADRWLQAGASMVGGCCGITSDHIAALHTRYKG